MRFGMMTLLTTVAILALTLLAVPPVQAGDNARLMGRVLDKASGDPLVGFSVYLDGTTLGAMTDLDGYYVIKKIPPGTYTMIISGIGYNQMKVEALAVTAGETRSLDFSLEAETVQMDSIVVKGRMLRNTGATMLKHREKADFVGDAISAEEISRSGASDAASAMERVTGASVVGDKYIYIRGLGDRYANTQLNGTPLPSPDPDKQAVPMDLIPSNLLDNIVVQKTFTPDKPGNFSGGSVNLTTKDLPTEQSLVFSNTAGYNTNTTGNENYLFYAGGSKDWAGYDDGTRELPAAADTRSPHYLRARRYLDSAVVLNNMTDAFKPEMVPHRKAAPWDQSYALSYGNQVSLFERPLGMQASLTYSRKYSYYDDGTVGKWHKAGDAEFLNNQYLVSDSKGAENVLWGGLLSLSYHLHTNHKLSFDYMRNQNGESSARLMSGSFGEQVQGTWRTRTLQYTERHLSSVQLKGEHELGLIMPVHAEWFLSRATSEQDEPDLRFVSDHYRLTGDSLNPDTAYYMTAANYPLPTRYFRTLNENNREGRLDISVPLSKTRRDAGKIQFGMADLSKDREFREREFRFVNSGGSAFAYDGNLESLFSTDNLGIAESQSDLADSSWVIGNSYQDASEPGQNYDGSQKIFAWYGMINIPLFSRLQVITGVRRESTQMDVVQVSLPADSSHSKLIDKSEWLPALNLRYSLGHDMNLRAAYGKTLARPNLREMAPFTSDEFVGGYQFTGNEHLDYTLIDNYDLRWEWFPGPGEVFAVSGFYKYLKDPIEIAILEFNGAIQPQNVPRARLYGAEFEWRKNLGVVSHSLRHFQMGGNLTLVHSEEDIPANEMVWFDSTASDTRSLQGQSPYIVNLEVSYLLPEQGFVTSIMFNRFGKRFAINAQEDTPDIFEQPRSDLNFTLSKELYRAVTVKFAAKNLLNSKTRLTHEYNGQEYIYQSSSTGRSYTIGLTYNVL